MKETKILVGVWCRTRKTLVILTSFVLFGLTFSSCKDCCKDQKNADPVEKNDSIPSGGGSSDGGNPAQVVIPLAPTLDDLQNKIKEVMVGVLCPKDAFNKSSSPSSLTHLIGALDKKNTGNAFTVVFLKAYGAWNLINSQTEADAHSWLGLICDVYSNRIRWACYLHQKYNSNDDNLSNDFCRNYANDALERCNKDESLRLYRAALASINTMKKNKSNLTLTNDWDALYNNDSQLMRDADKQWDELGKIVDAYRKAHP
jgi:hypothetical protein